MRFICLITSILLSTPALAQDLAYVQSVTAKLQETPSFQAAVLGHIPRGDAVTVLVRQGRWCQVRYGAQAGWVAALLLAPQAPSGKVNISDEDRPADDAQNKARRRASAGSTAAATRGLRSDGHARASEENNADYSALQVLEGRQATDQEVRQFQEEEAKP